MYLLANEKNVKANDKQLQGVTLEHVLEKRRLDQALNAKEFAVCAGVSYSTARNWFRLHGFPSFHAVVFWQDFVQWRTGQNNLKRSSEKITPAKDDKLVSNLPLRAEHILWEA